MCLATVYIEQGDQREEVMHDVAWVRSGSHGLQLTTLMGESRQYQANIKVIDLMKGSIVLEKQVDDSNSDTHFHGQPR